MWEPPPVPPPKEGETYREMISDALLVSPSLGEGTGEA